MKEGMLPDNSLVDMVLGTKSGCLGEVSGLLIAVGGIYLLARRVITWHIPVAYIGTVMLITFLFPMAGEDAVQFMLYQTFSGGLILGAVFMATDYVTSPITEMGKLIFGVGCGLLTVFIRYFGGYPEGVSFAILIMNILSPYIEKWCAKVPLGKVGK